MEAQVADNPAVVSNETPEIKAEAEAPIKDVPKLEEVENSSDKAPAPETPVTPATEPLSNGSGAPESPKEEIRQNGDAPSVEEKPTPVEAAPEPVPEPESVEAPAVDSLPVNGLKIEDVAEETQAVQENKVEESAPEKMEVKSAESAATEVCVAKEKPEVAGSAEVAPPPLPSCPPPSSLTIFAESTMAPHLVDDKAVDVEASLSSDPSLPPATESEEAAATPVCPNSVGDAPSALPSDDSKSERPPVETPGDSPIASTDEEINTPLHPSTLNAENVDVQSCTKSEVVEVNLAVVSSDSVTESPKPVEPPAPPREPESAVPDPADAPKPEVASESSRTAEEIDAGKVESAIAPPTPADDAAVDSTPEPAKAPAEAPAEAPAVVPAAAPAVAPAEAPAAVPVEAPAAVSAEEPAAVSAEAPAEVSAEAPAVVSAEAPAVVPAEAPAVVPAAEAVAVPAEVAAPESSSPKEESLPSVESSSANVDESVPAVGAGESPLPQRTPSDPDVSECSFPPPPPPVSCPESMTELSASESLPPPLSESSQPDAVLNSPTSEIADFPPKDLPSPVKDDGNTELKGSVEPEISSVALNTETQAEPTPLPENSVPSPAEVVQEAVANTVAEAPTEKSKVEEPQRVPSADATQIKSVSEIIDVPAVIDAQPEITDSIVTENSVATE